MQNAKIYNAKKNFNVIFKKHSFIINLLFYSRTVRTGAVS